MTSKKEKLLYKTFEKLILLSMNKLPVEMLNEITGKKFMAYGTAIDEKLLSVEDCRNLILTQKKQAKGLKFERQVIPVFRKISPEEDSATFVDEMKVRIKTGDDVHDLFLRFTTILEYADNKWEVVHFHTSKPDDTIGESDTWHIDEWKRKNEELQRLVDEKTADLVKKNRDLEIEASLERVRTVSMSMKKQEDLLDICESLFKELHSLGFNEMRNAMINIFKDDDETFVNYDFSDVLGKSITPLYYNIHPIIKKQVKQVRKSKDAYTETVFMVKDLADWKKFRKSRGEKNDPRLKKAKALHYYFYSVGTAAIGISTFSPITNEKKQILKRFRNVFDFAYRRYTDVTLAESQAREARIEASLERVRARSMAMHHSDELVDASIVLFNELKSLDIEAIRTGVAIIDRQNETLEIWSSQLIEEKRNKILGVVPFKSHPFFEGYYKAWKKKQPYFFYEIKGKEVKKYYDEMSSLLSYPKRKEFNPKECFYTFFFPEGSLNVVSKNILTEDECKLMTRFAGVFGLIYRRFLDLQKAEAQAREAKIEAALERVRSRTMAMHSSNELQEAAILLFQQIRDLGVDTGSCGYVIWEKEKRNATVWMSSAEGEKQTPFKLSHTKSKIYKEIYSAKEFGKDFFVKEVRGGELRKHFDYLMTVPGIGERIRQLRKARYKFPDMIVYNSAFFKQGYLSFHTHKQSPETHDIFKRFANVFEQTYTRFLDLQKAEAQTREAQIEAALERVRSKTMAMHNSEDVGETVVTMFDELTKLGIKPYRCGIGIFNDNKQLEAWSARTDAKGKTVIVIGKLDMTKHPLLQGAYDGWKKGLSYFDFELTGKDVLKYFKVINKLPDYPVKYDIRNLPKRILHHDFYFPEGTLFAFTLEPLSDEAKNIFNRFASVFGQTYRRYLDLKKAEAQAREAQIQLALERIRAKAMAMQKSDELLEVSLELYSQFKELDSSVSGLTINIINKKERVFEVSFGKFNQSFKLSIDEQIVMSKAYKCWKSGKKSLVLELRGKDLIHFNKIRNKAIGTEIFSEKYRSETQLILYMAIFTHGMLIAGMNDHRPKETTDILQRFASVFDLTYTRFLDLKKAEAQAREAQIEAALERVRSRTMGMQKSEELKEVIQIVYEQFVYLNINTEHAGFIMDYKTRDDFDNWIADPRRVPFRIIIPYFDSLIYNRFNEAKQKGENFFTLNLSFKEKNNFYKKLFKFVPGLTEEVKKFYFSCPGLAFSTVLLENVALYIENFSGTSFTDEENSILMRFGKVFQQTYTRFLDLQKAETQAREAQIEAALERVRGKAMAMHSSSDLTDAAGVLFTELIKLGTKPIRTGFVLLSKESRKAKLYLATTFDNKNTISFTGEIEFTGHPVYEKQYESWQKNENYFPVMEGDLLKSYYKILAEGISIPFENFPIDEKQFGTFLPFSEGFLFAWSVEPCSENELKILERFKNILDLTIRRYTDLKKAEEQAREAQIEAALERVRSKAMAMQKSDDLGTAVATIFDELDKLDLGILRCGIGIIKKENKSVDVWATAIADNKKTVQISGDESLDTHPLLQGAFDAWLRQEDFSYLLQGEDLINYYKTQIQSNFKLPDSQSILTEDEMYKQYYHVAVFQSGGLFAFRESEFPEEAKSVIKRFADVINFTYTRFNDLKLAEAQAKEARIEAALERVRSRTLAMQKSDELAETAAVVFKQLINLGIEPNRLFIGIINDDSGDIEAWATDEDGSKVSRRFKPNINANASVKKMYDGWAEKKSSIVIDMQGKELEEYLHYIGDVLHVPFKDGFSQERRVQNIAYFSHGFIGMASPDPQPEETAELLERFAAVFNLTFTRFNDLKIAENHAEQAKLDLIKLQTEKKRAEEALTELRATQTQLIQSEKMASLGELTAGIAHEIQNPLNFVNNFSEVNAELIDELNQEIEKGNFDEAALIAKDIKENEEKIKHHGKRAEGIVKGMLQHSRSSSGVKESVNINALADEYLRLAYHGLRAKDKTFNAKMETDFDESIGEINVVPQEIGRVILNLITNAFYAVTEKKNEGIKDYEPTIKVSTKKSDDKVLISVKDNGNGIPQKVMDKIFQPFFTTKPTGQGTGLGLSMSYDIIKSHGGELKVETKEGEGSEFVIVLNV